MEKVLNKFITVYTLFCLMLPTLLFGQSTGYIENFNDGNVNGWVSDHGDTFKLNSENESLKIDYSRTASSGEWDNFNFTPPNVIDHSENKFISVKVKSDVGTQLIFKPVFEDGSSDWLQTNLIGDNQWRTISFELTVSTNFRMKKLYLYLDGGTTISRAGTVYFDDVAFGDSANIELDFTVLENAIIDANNLLNSTQEGTNEGDFELGSKSELIASIQTAQELLNTKTEDRSILDNTIWALYDHCVKYESKANVGLTNQVDIYANKQTKYLFANLVELSEKGVLFGMHATTGYGVGWSGNDDRSDVKDVCGDFPAIYSEDANHIERNYDIERVRYRIKSAYQRGGINTFVWHQYDPDNRSFYAANINNERIVAQIIPGGSRHEDYKSKLYKLASFFKSLRGSNGEAIPIIFRPYHEHTGNWFWWGPAHCTTEEYKNIWKFTFEYLHDTLNVHNLLWAISPSFQHFSNSDNYQNIYPGDEYIDIIGADKYFNSNTIAPSELQNFVANMEVMNNLATEKKKLSALTEVGNENLVNPNWFTDILGVIKDERAIKISYAAVWRNESTTHHFAPYPGHSSAPDFIKFYNDPFIIFEQNLPNMYILPVDDLEAPIFVNIPDTTIIATSTIFSVKVETNEKAFVKYSLVDEPYEEMPNTFVNGQGFFEHSTNIEAEHGDEVTIFLRASDRIGNIMNESIPMTFLVDTMKALVAWYHPIYPIDNWNLGASPLGSSGTANTTLNNVQTYYFKADINISEIPNNFAILIKSFGGGVLYLNNNEISRINFAATADINYNSVPTTDAPFNSILTLDSIALGHLRTGINTFAIEIHANLTSSPSSFDAQLFDENGIVLPLGSEWKYFDLGYQPEDIRLENITSINEIEAIPLLTRLNNNYPNPFNASTVVSFDISKTENVRVEIFNILGQRIRTLVNNKLNAGNYKYIFNASGLASGVYIVMLNTNSSMQRKKIILMK